MVLIAAAGIWLLSGVIGTSMFVAVSAAGVGVVFVALIWTAIARHSIRTTILIADNTAKVVARTTDTQAPAKVVRLALPTRIYSSQPPYWRPGRSRRPTIVATRTGAEITFTLPELDRGFILAGPVLVGVFDPLRLAVRWVPNGTIAQLPILPHQASDPLSDGAGKLPSIDPDDPTILREWRPGDPISKIHWRTSARIGLLQVRDANVDGATATTDVVVDGRLDHRSTVASGLSDGSTRSHRHNRMLLTQDASLEHSVANAIDAMDIALAAGQDVRLSLITNTDGVVLSHSSALRGELALSALVATPEGARTLPAASLPAATPSDPPRRKSISIPSIVDASTSIPVPRRHRYLASSVGVMALFVLGVVTWSPLLTGNTWLSLGLSIAAPSWVVTVSGMCWLRRRWFAIAGGLAVFAISVSVASTLTDTSWDAWTSGQLLNHTLAAIQTGSPPMNVDLQVGIVIGSVLGAAGALSAVLWACSPLLGILPALCLLAVPDAILGAGTELLPTAIATICLLLALIPVPGTPRDSSRSSASTRRHINALLSRVLAGAVVVLIGCAIPVAVGTPSLRTLGLDKSLISPLQVSGQSVLVTLGSDLRSGDTTVLFDHTETGADGAYLALTALDNFTGNVWKPSNLLPGSDTLASWPESGSSSLRVGRRVSTNIEISGLASSWLPLPEGVQSVGLPPGGPIRNLLPLSKWNWISGTDFARGSEDTLSQRGQRYTASAVMLRDSSQLQFILDRVTNGFNAGPTLTTAQREHYTALPSDVPNSFTQLANQIDTTTSAAAWGHAAVDYFTGSSFTYSETAPVEQGFDGSGVAAVTKFLTVRSGYCQHFAAAMALLARAHGVPSRIMVGYRPGTLVSDTDGNRTYQVTNRELHAWPQLFIDGVGWVSFEPTPGMDANAASNTEDNASVSASPSPSSESNDATSTPTPTPSKSSSPSEPKGSGDDAVESQSSHPVITIARAVGWGLISLVFLTLLVSGVTYLWATSRRRHRLSHDDRESAVATWVWLAVRDAGIDSGVLDASDHRQTVRKQAQYLHAVLDQAGRNQLAHVVHAFEAERYGTNQLPLQGFDSSLSSDGAALCQQLRKVRVDTTSRWRRVIRGIVPLSLFLR